ncbi:MAG: hypothetical protein KAZ14_00600 [Nitrosomonas sp.]|nr:hypothetical protein [Nitrosomonas sp.]
MKMLNWKLIATLMMISTSSIAQVSPAVQSFNTTKLTSVPTDVIAAVAAFPSVNSLGITGYQRINQQIFKAESITINARSLATFERFDAPFVALVAKDLYIEIPDNAGNVAKLTRAPDNAFQALNGAHGTPGFTGVSPGGESGAPGGTGGTGGAGGAGGTTRVPDIYIFYNRIITSAGNPASSGLLRILSNGVPGWNGGNGGVGGSGGWGSTGTPASCGILTCNAGPGIGGDGGSGGSGGKGGNAGSGGRGGNVYIVGPRADFNQAAFFEIFQEGASPGHPGAPGVAGSGGLPGGGGRMCTYCNGRGPGNPGSSGNPPNLGGGTAGVRGDRGDRGLIDRNNTDLF